MKINKLLLNKDIFWYICRNQEIMVDMKLGQTETGSLLIETLSLISFQQHKPHIIRKTFQQSKS